MGQILIFACGNKSRGDDALAPLLLDYVEHKGFSGIRGVQLNIEHAFDLIGVGLALFINADVSVKAPYRFERLNAATKPHSAMHALHPAVVLSVFKQVTGLPVPPAFVLSVRGEAFALGSGLSTAAMAHLSAAKRLLDQLLRNPDADHWQAFLTEPCNA